MSEEKLILNEAADACANAAAAKHCRTKDGMMADIASLRIAYLIALRIAVTEADVWKYQPEKTNIVKDNNKMKQQQQDRIAKNVDQTGEAVKNKHSVYVSGNWLRCRHCSGKSSVEVSGRDCTKKNNYWTKTPCSYIAVRSVKRKVEGSALEYKLYDEAYKADIYDVEEAPQHQVENGLSPDITNICQHCGEMIFIMRFASVPSAWRSCAGVARRTTIVHGVSITCAVAVIAGTSAK